jgi:hypothetical protein
MERVLICQLTLQIVKAANLAFLTPFGVAKLFDVEFINWRGLRG